MGPGYESCQNHPTNSSASSPRLRRVLQKSQSERQGAGFSSCRLSTRNSIDHIKSLILKKSGLLRQKEPRLESEVDEYAEISLWKKAITTKLLKPRSESQRE